MTTGEYTPLLRDGSGRSSATQHHLAINSHYYDITDLESWPIAGLLVLLDGQAMPVRAELHMYDDLRPHVQESAIRQARLVLQERYLGGVPVPVRILETFQVREEMLVRLPPVGARQMSMPSIPMRWRRYGTSRNGIIAGSILAVVLLIWVVIALMRPGQETVENPGSASTPAAADQPGGQEAAQVVAEGEGESGGEGEQVANPPAGESNLPVSRNARGDLGIGMRVQVVPGLRLALRSEPGADRGIVVGEMSEGVIATIIGGPEYTQGDSDTIVWWFVELPNTTQAWAAANTSQQTLLMPAP